MSGFLQNNICYSSKIDAINNHISRLDWSAAGKKEEKSKILNMTDSQIEFVFPPCTPPINYFSGLLGALISFCVLMLVFRFLKTLLEE